MLAGYEKQVCMKCKTTTLDAFEKVLKIRQAPIDCSGILVPKGGSGKMSVDYQKDQPVKKFGLESFFDDQTTPVRFYEDRRCNDGVSSILKTTAGIDMRACN